MRRRLLALAALTPLALALTPAVAPTATAAPVVRTATPHRADGDVAVSTVAYNLGDQVFVDPEVTEYDDDGDVVPMELAAIVHYPTDLGRGEHPLIVMEHGSWWTCVNTAKQKPVAPWPCTKGTTVLRSYRGYDYLARTLAAKGFIVVSISANAINAHVLGDVGYLARAHLVNKHLQLWQKLAAGDGSRLRGRFTDPATGKRVQPRFRGHVDMQRVGTLGHSRGGKGVMWQASDKHTPEWPAGVRVQAVVGLAPVYFTPPGENNRNTRVTKVPFLVVTGSCDHTVGGDEPGTDYVADVEGLNPDATTVSITGGNHTYFNTRWTPPAVGGDDDGIDQCDDPAITPASQRSQTKDVVVPWYVDHLMR